jgi:hypothetical protein
MQLDNIIKTTKKVAAIETNARCQHPAAITSLREVLLNIQDSSQLKMSRRTGWETLSYNLKVITKLQK